MSKGLTLATTHLPEQPVSLQDFVTASRAPSTLRAYRTDWRCFLSWCEQEGVPALPASPEVVARFLVSQAGYKPATLSRRLAAINAAHELADHPSPTGTSLVGLTLSGIKRTYGAAQRQVRPVMTQDLQQLVATVGDDLVGVRDKALLLVGWAGALRRSELVAIQVEDLEFAAGGVVVMIRKSKTDQEAKGEEIGIPYGSTPDTCPVTALQAWLDASGISSGAIFRRIDQWGNLGVNALHPGTVAEVVKKRVSVLGLDPAQFAGHSLRSGLATSAAQNGASEIQIMAQTRHTSSAMVKRYIRK